MPLSSLLAIITLAAAALAAGGLYIYKMSHAGESSGLFAPRARRRLAFVERAHLDGGRKLLLVRRDEVEHLILIGGPIDLIVETGIQPVDAIDGVAEEDDFEDPARTAPASAWRLPSFSPQAGKEAAPSGPQLSLSPDIGTKEEVTLELTPLEEAKAAQ